jgi:hypothetical protein
MKNNLWKRLILIWDNASYHVSQTVLNFINKQKDWLTIIRLPKKAPYLNPDGHKNWIYSDGIRGIRGYRIIQVRNRKQFIKFLSI